MRLSPRVLAVMELMDGNFEPIPSDLQQKLRVMSHDLLKVKQNVAAGRVRPEEYTDLERTLGARLGALEAEVHARLLDESRKERPFRRGGAG
jgi:hypothetical protein